MHTSNEFKFTFIVFYYTIFCKLTSQLLNTIFSQKKKKTFKHKKKKKKIIKFSYYAIDSVTIAMKLSILKYRIASLLVENQTTDMSLFHCFIHKRMLRVFTNYD